MFILAMTTTIFMIATAFFAYKSYKFGLIILQTQDAIEASLDILDERYARMTEILQKPVFFDSLEVRQAIEDISMSKDAILYVANRISSAQEVFLNEETNKDGRKEE
jgi:hypothetical protein